MAGGVYWRKGTRETGSSFFCVRDLRFGCSIPRIGKDGFGPVRILPGQFQSCIDHRHSIGLKHAPESSRGTVPVFVPVAL